MAFLLSLNSNPTDSLFSQASVPFSPMLCLPYYHHGVRFIMPYPSWLNCDYLKQLIQPKYGVNLYKKKFSPATTIKKEEICLGSGKAKTVNTHSQLFS